MITLAYHCMEWFICSIFLNVCHDPVKYPLHLCPEMYATMKIIADLTKFHETK